MKPIKPPKDRYVNDWRTLIEREAFNIAGKKPVENNNLRIMIQVKFSRLYCEQIYMNQSATEIVGIFTSI